VVRAEPYRTKAQSDESGFDLTAGDLTLHVPDGDLARRWENWRPPTITYDRGYLASFAATAGQADRGCVATFGN
jgi:dihydroxyacid dehydratase/phosphogluconate dehydratase